MMKKKISIFLFSTCITFSAFAQWEKISTKSYPNMELNDIYVKGEKIIAVGTLVDVGAGKFAGHIFTSINSGMSGFIGGYGGSSVMLETYNGGGKWDYNIVDTVNKGIVDMQFLNSRTGFAVGYGTSQFFSGNSYKTTDGGMNWQATSDSMRNLPLEAISFIDENLGYGVASTFGFKTFAKTTDGGTTWKLFYTHTTGIADIYFWNSDDGIFVDIEGGIYKTSDGAKTWVKKVSPTTKSLLAVSFLDRNTGFAVGTEGTIIKTANGGETWQTVTSPTSEDLANVELYENRFYAVGTNGIILRSEKFTGTRELKLTDRLNIYPNPASSQLFITSPGTKTTALKITITDINSRMVNHQVISNLSREGIDISYLPNGIYFLEIESATEKAMKKIWIQHE